MSLSQNICFRDKALLPTRMGRAFNLIDLFVWSLIGSIQLSSQGSVFFFLGGIYEVGAGAVLDNHGGGSESIIVFHAWQSSLWPRVVALRLETLSPRGKQHEGSMGAFLKLSSMKHSSFQSFDLFLRINGRWCDIITSLYVLSESVWLSKRCVSGGEEMILYPKDLFFLWRNLSELPPGLLDDGVNNKVVPP